MQQYFGVDKKDNKLFLALEDLNHIKNVMRMKENDEIIVAYEKDLYQCKLNKDLKTADIIKSLDTLKPSGELIVYFPILVEEKVDFILQKGTELGVTKFIPVEFECCKFKLKNDVKQKKITRWNKIVKEASEQTHRIDLPKVENVIKVDNIVKDIGVNILCSLDKENVKSIDEVLNKNNVYDTITIVFGPEGGITKTESEILESKGYIKTSLGKSVLRSETVVLYVASIIRFLKLGGNNGDTKKRN